MGDLHGFYSLGLVMDVSIFLLHRCPSAIQVLAAHYCFVKLAPARICHTYLRTGVYWLCRLLLLDERTSLRIVNWNWNAGAGNFHFLYLVCWTENVCSRCGDVASIDLTARFLVSWALLQKCADAGILSKSRNDFCNWFRTTREIYQDKF